MIAQVIANILLSTSIYLLVASSFSLIYYPTKFFHFAHAAIISLGAYFLFLFETQFLFPFFIDLILALVGAIGFGISCELFIYRFLRRKNASPLMYLVTSIGLYVVMQNLISLYFGDGTKIIKTGEVLVGHQIFGAYLTTLQLITIFTSITLFAGLILFLNFSSIGKSIRATASNLELSNIYGIDSNRIIVIAFGIGSALAGISGILSAMDTSMTPTFGFNILLYGFVAMIIGGVGSTKGMIGGALLVATAQQSAVYFLDAKWINVITYIILILFLIWKPLGFSGNRLHKNEI